MSRQYTQRRRTATRSDTQCAAAVGRPVRRIGWTASLPRHRFLVAEMKIIATDVERSFVLGYN